MNKALFSILVMGAVYGPCAEAQLLNFDFSFTGESPPGLIGGTVSGEIFELQNNATTTTPSDIVLTSVLSGFELSLPPRYSLRNNGWDLTGDPMGASFTVSNGRVTSATAYEASLPSKHAFLTFEVPVPPNDGTLTGILNGFQYLSTAGEGYVFDTSGAQGIVFTLINAPEPSDWVFGSARGTDVRAAAMRADCRVASSGFVRGSVL